MWNFKSLPENMIMLSKNADVSKDLVLVFESFYVALLACQVSLLWYM